MIAIEHSRKSRIFSVVPAEDHDFFVPLCVSKQRATAFMIVVTLAFHLIGYGSSSAELFYWYSQA